MVPPILINYNESWNQGTCCTHSSVALSSAATQTMISAIFLVMQLPHMEAKCQSGEYETKSGCCPMCSAGNRVVKICTEFISTTCFPCVEDTYTEHPNGLTECMRCKVCVAGARLIVKEKCTYTKNTVCGCAPGDFCSLATDRDCDMCSQYTVCLPGSMVKKPGTDFVDNVCEDCPQGTFSATNMSLTCQQWTKCKEQGVSELKAGTSTSDAVCDQGRVLWPVWAVMVPIGIVSLAGAPVYYLWKRWTGENGMTPAQETGAGNETRKENLVSAAENGATAHTSVQESGQQARMEESKSFLSLESERVGT